MNLAVNGEKIVDVELFVDPEKLDSMAAAIGTATGATTALLCPFFIGTANGEGTVADPLELDYSRALEGGLAYEWHRPFRSGEIVRLQIVVADIIEKNAGQFATLVGEFRAADGELIQRQRLLMIERSEE